jgi:hypothetical protein
MNDGPNNVHIRRLRLRLDRASLPRARQIVRALAQELGAQHAENGAAGVGEHGDEAPGNLHARIPATTAAESPRAFAQRAVKALTGNGAATPRKPSPSDFRQR